MRRDDTTIVLKVAAGLMDWIPLSETRALRWATDLLSASPQHEPTESSMERIDDAAKAAARYSRDVRYFDVFTAMTGMIRREFEERARAKKNLELKALPPITDGGKAARLSIGVYGDIAAKLLPQDCFDAELAMRREMSEMEIEERRNELLAQRGHSRTVI